MFAESDSFPKLVAADGQRFTVAPGHSTIGRHPDAEIHLIDQTVGRHHAGVDATPAGVTLTDLHSTNGTWVNDRRVEDGSAVRLRHGDVVRLGAIQLRFVAPSGDHTAQYQHVAGTGDDARAVLPPPIRAAAGPQFTAAQQNAEQINNVARDQYLQAITQQRESFLREVAASRTRAKRLIWFGFLLFAVGGGLFAWMVIRFISRVSELDPAEQPSPSEIWGEEIGGVPLGFIGWAVAAVGMLMMIVGIVLHIVATSRQRRTVNEPVIPPEWLRASSPSNSGR